MVDPNAQTKADGIAIKVGNVPVAIQSTSLALILGTAGMVWSNFSTLQDKVSDTGAGQAVIEQQLDHLKSQIDSLRVLTAEQAEQRASLAKISMEHALFVAKTEDRLDDLEAVLEKKGRKP